MLSGRKEKPAFIDWEQLKVSFYAFLERFKTSTVGFHKFRTLVGITLTTLFLIALFSNPLLLPSNLALIAFWLQNTFLPFMATLGLGSVTTALVATIGSFLTLTAPKWVGNLLQFVGERLIGSICSRIFVGLLLIVTILGESLNVLDHKEFFKKDNHPITNFFVVIFLGIPAGIGIIGAAITGGTGWLIDKIGSLIAGEYNYSYLEQKLKEKNKDPDISTRAKLQKRLDAMIKDDEIKAFATPIINQLSPEDLSPPPESSFCMDLGDDIFIGLPPSDFPNDSAEVAEKDPAIFGPMELRRDIAKGYVNAMNKLSDLFKFCPSAAIMFEEGEATKTPRPSS